MKRIGVFVSVAQRFFIFWQRVERQRSEVDFEGWYQSLTRTRCGLAFRTWSRLRRGSYLRRKETSQLIPLNRPDFSPLSITGGCFNLAAPSAPKSDSWRSFPTRE